MNERTLCSHESTAGSNDSLSLRQVESSRRLNGRNGMRPRRNGDSNDRRLKSAAVFGYSVMLFVAVCQVLFASNSDPNTARWFYFISSMAAASAIFFTSWASAPVAATPLNLFAVVWLVLVPSTFGAVPLMEPMSPAAIGACALGVGVFSLGGLLATIGLRSKRCIPRRRPHGDFASLYDQEMRSAARIVLLLSISALVANFVAEGGFALLGGVTETRKTAGTFAGFPLLASLGTVSMSIFAKLGETTKSDLLLILSYVSLQLLGGQRFVAIFGLLLVAVALGERPSVRVLDLFRICATFATVAGGFLAVGVFRGGQSDKQRFFIDTGLTDASLSTLAWTEPLRYVGMSQRNLTEVIERDFADGDLLRYTASPITALINQTPTSLGTSQFGYTANNVVAYLHQDLGVLWPLGMLVLGVVVNLVFWRSRRSPDSAARAFTWHVAGTGILLSFFAYANAYVYWVLVFPIFIALVDRRARRRVRQRLGSTTRAHERAGRW